MSQSRMLERLKAVSRKGFATKDGSGENCML